MNQEQVNQPTSSQSQPKKFISPLIAWSIIILVAGATGFAVWYSWNQIDTISGNISISAVKKTSTDKTETATTTTPAADTSATADWKTYTNTDYGFSFKYPTSMTLAEKDWVKDGDEIATLTSSTSTSKTPDISIRYAKATAKTTVVTSNTIGVWLTDQFTSDITVKNVTKETINGVKFNDAEMQADPSYFAMLATNGNGIYAIDFSVTNKNQLTDTIKNVLSTFQFSK